MTNADQIAVVLTTTLSLLGVLALLRWPYRHYRADRFRDELFEIRAALFRMAAHEGSGVSYEDAAYGLLRTTLNGFIRFGDKLDLPSFIALAFTKPDGRAEGNSHAFVARWEKALGELDENARREILCLERRMHRATAVHLVLSTPLLITIVAPLLMLGAIPFVAARLGSWIWQSVAPLFVRIDSAAQKVGEARLA